MYVSNVTKDGLKAVHGAILTANNVTLTNADVRSFTCASRCFPEVGVVSVRGNEHHITMVPTITAFIFNVTLANSDFLFVAEKVDGDVVMRNIVAKNSSVARIEGNLYLVSYIYVVIGGELTISKGC